MKTLINARFIAKPQTGVTLVGAELLRALLALIAGLPATERPSLILAAPQGFALPLPEGFDLSDHEAWLSIRNGPASAPGEQTLIPERYGAEQVLSFCNQTPILARKLAVWIHDAQIFDSAESYSPGFRLYHQSLFRALALRKAQMATVSHYSKSRLVHYGADPNCVTVIHNGGNHLQRFVIDESALVQHGLKQKPYAFMVGSRAKHKNIAFAIDALLKQGPQDLTIAVAGLHQAGSYAGQIGTWDSTRVVILPRISEGQLRALYRNAQFVMCPSLDEGFGLSAAEALWENAPLGLSNRASLPEVGGEAALYFDPQDAASLGAVAHQLCLENTRTMLKAKADSQKSKLTWENAAKATFDAFVKPHKMKN